MGREQRVAQGPRRDARREQVGDPGDVARRTSPSCGRPSGGGRSGARSARTASRSPPRTGRSRPRGAGRPGPRRRCGRRTTPRGSAWTSPSTRGASPGARARSPSPRRARRPGALPEHEVADVVLRVLVGRDALADAHLVRVEPGQPPVGRPARDPEEDRAVVGPVGVAARRGGARRARPSRGCARSPGAGRPAGVIRSVARVVEEAGDPAFGEVVDPDPLGGRAADDLVVDVGQVHHPGDPEAAPAQVPDEEVGEQERPEVADVGRAVDRRAAGVDPDVAGLERLERRRASPRQRVVEPDRHAGDPPGAARRRRRRRRGRRCRGRRPRSRRGCRSRP